MERIKNRVIWFCAALIFFAGGAGFIRTESGITLLLWIGFSAAFLFLLVRELTRYRSAMLIAENGFLRIRAAVLETENQEEVLKGTGSLTVIVSCFGVLMGDRSVKFNQDGIPLRGVEITPGYILLSFGTEEKIQKLSILHGTLDESQRKTLSERFKFETGVTPVME